jgi:hypothetical protein
MGDAPLNVGMEPREQFLMPDLQAGALGWLLSHRLLGALTHGNLRRARAFFTLSASMKNGKKRWLP